MQNSDTCERKRNSFISHKEMRLGACEHTHTHKRTHTQTEQMSLKINAHLLELSTHM